MFFNIEKFKRSFQKLFFFISVVFNSTLNFIILSFLLYLSNYNFLNINYFISSAIVITQSYYTNRIFVFKTRRKINNFKKFFLLEIFLTLLTIFIFEILEIFFGPPIFLSIIILYIIRFITTFFLYFFYIFRE